MMYIENENEQDETPEREEEGLTLKQVATYTAAGLGLVAAIGGAISVLPPFQPPPGTTPRPAYVTETEQSTQGNVIDMGDYQVTLPSSMPLTYADQDARTQGKEWTILVYSAADNNLEPYLMADNDDMETVGSDKYVDVVVQVDRGKVAEGQVDSGERAWTGARRYHLQKDAEKGKINSPMLGELGQVNMADPDVLADFLEWGVNNYPADNYMLIISDHGAGWTGAIGDDSSGDHEMTWVEVQEALGKVQQRTGAKIDVLGYDACLMASAEGAYQVRSVTDFLVASQELEGAEGWPYEGIMGNRALVVMEKFSTAFKDGKRPELTPKLMSFLIVKEAENDQRNLRTLSAVEVEKMPKVAEAMDGFAEALRESKVPISEFNKIADESFHYGRQWWFVEPLVDAVELAEKVSANEAYGADVRVAAAKVIEAIDQVVVAEQHNETSHPNAHGLHIYVPFEGRTSFDGEKYGELDFAEDTQWDEFLRERANSFKDEK